MARKTRRDKELDERNKDLDKIWKQQFENWKEEAKRVLSPIVGEDETRAILEFTEKRRPGFNFFVPQGKRREIMNALMSIQSPAGSSSYEVVSKDTVYVGWWPI